MHHSAFEYASFPDLMSSYKRIKGEGITPAFCLDHMMTVSMYYKDPESNFVELQADGFGDWKLSSEFMRTSPDFAVNPIGFFLMPIESMKRIDLAWSSLPCARQYKLGRLHLLNCLISDLDECSSTRLNVCTSRNSPEVRCWVVPHVLAK